MIPSKGASRSAYIQVPGNWGLRAVFLLFDVVCHKEAVVFHCAEKRFWAQRDKFMDTKAYRIKEF